MTRVSYRTRNLVLIGMTVALAAGGAWWFLLRSDAPDPVSLDEAVAEVTGSTVAATSTLPASSTTPERLELAGVWETVAGNGSFAGYRVEEELARIGFTTAAGRTGDVTATLTIEGNSVVAVAVQVDMQTLESDDNRRDRAIRQQALETNSFPDGSFTLTEPIDLPAGASEGGAFTVTAVGDLELHGVVNRVEVAIEAQLIDGIIAVVGSAEILFDDYDIDKPSALGVLSVDDKGIMEFQLLFTRG